MYKEGAGIDYYFSFYMVPFSVFVISLINIFYIILYTKKFPEFEKLKSNNLPWPWEENWEKFKSDAPNIVWTYIRNNFMVFPIVFNLIFTFYNLDLNIDTMPSYPRFLFNVWFSFVIEDFFFYWVHRLLHHPKMYWIHKKHHKFYNTFHMACIYTHWIEFVLGNVLPILAGSMIL